MRRFIVGAGAQGRVVLENWRAAHPDSRFFFLDDDEKLHGTKVLGVDVAGSVASIASLPADVEIVIAVGDNRRRLEIAQRLGSVPFGTVIHPSAVVMPSATIGPGSVVFAGAIVNTEARIGEHVVVNTGVILEHDAVIGRGASLSPGTRSGGRVQVGEGAFVSTGVTLAPRVKIGDYAVIGAGAVVVRDVPANTLAYGVPAKAIRTIDASFDFKRLL